LIDGPVLLAEALAAEVDIESIYVEPEALNHESVWAARAAQIRVKEVTRGALRKVLEVAAPQDMVAVAKQRQSSATDLIRQAVATKRPLLVLVELADPGNVGTLIRVAEASGCVGVVLTERTVDLYNPKTVRATAGAVFRVEVAENIDASQLLSDCAAAGLSTFATVLGSGVLPEDAPLAQAGALFLGSEAHGLDVSLVQQCTSCVSIPMDGHVESLNAAVAGSVFLFEAARQRRVAGVHSASAELHSPKPKADDQ
jgi:TrmH family RNA methyltransferase